MKINKRFIFLILACAFILVSIYFINLVYAKYLTSADGTAAIPIAKWNIIVNNQTIKENADISNTIVPVFPGNEYIAANIIAPTATGYFDLNFDCTGVDVAFKYDITISNNENSAVKDLVTTGYSIDGGATIPVETIGAPISDTFSLNATNKTRTIRIFIEWNDDAETATMNNVDDTMSTIGSSSEAKLDVNVLFTQVAG